MFIALAATLMFASQSNPPEPLRPQFHFTAQKGWLNDPNGLVFFRGEYHLFFQHNPFGPQWGNMTWGHAVSKDLIHWRQLPSAIEPDEHGTIFSGSAVVDLAHTSGLGDGQYPPMVCIYTAAGGTNDASKGQPFTQRLAYSVDGRTFTKLPGDPILKHIEAENRDPKVIWHAPTKRWIMALYLNGHHYALFGSSNLQTWMKLSDVELEGDGECPDFFEIAVDGDRRRTRWVFTGASGRYLVGQFDGKTFTSESKSLPTYLGNTNYAAQTYFNDPKGRRIQIAWMRGADFPGTVWNQQMGFPTELKLVTTPQGERLAALPVREISNLRLRSVKPSDDRWVIESGLYDATLQFTVPPTGRLNLVANGHPISYDAGSHELRCLDRVAHVDVTDGRLKLRILADRSSLEIYAQDGLTNMAMFLLPVPGARGLEAQVPADWKLEKSTVFELKPAEISRS